MLDTESSGQKLDGAKPKALSQDFSEIIDLFYGNWIWRAVHALIEHPKFNSSPKWIAETLNISVEEALDALEGLEDFGLVFRDGNTLKIKGQNVLLPEEKKTREFAIGKHKQLSQQILAASTPASIDCAYSFFFSMSTSDLWKSAQNFASSLEALDQAESSKKEDATLYAITLTCNNVTPSLKMRGQK